MTDDAWGRPEKQRQSLQAASQAYLTGREEEQFKQDTVRFSFSSDKTKPKNHLLVAVWSMDCGVQTGSEKSKYYHNYGDYPSMPWQ